MDKINLGDKVRDQITGFEGIVIAETRWLDGCKRYGIQGQELKDLVPTDTQWVDDHQCELIKAAVFGEALIVHGVLEETEEPEPARKGGPRNDDPGPGQ